MKVTKELTVILEMNEKEARRLKALVNMCLNDMKKHCLYSTCLLAGDDVTKWDNSETSVFYNTLDKVIPDL